MLAGAIARVEEDRRRRIGAAEGPVVADIGPEPAGVGLALGQHRHGRVVAVHARAGEDMRRDQIVERPQRSGAAADLVGQRRQAQLDAFVGIALALAVERLMLAVLLEQDHRQQARAGPAARERMERRRRLADLLAVAAGELLAHVWITFHCRGTTSSVSVTSSPSLGSRVPSRSRRRPSAPERTTRSRGRCAGNGLRAGFFAQKARTASPSPRRPARRRARPRSAAASSSSSCSSICSRSRALRSLRAP